MRAAPLPRSPLVLSIGVDGGVEVGEVFKREFEPQAVPDTLLPDGTVIRYVGLTKAWQVIGKNGAVISGPWPSSNEATYQATSSKRQGAQ